MNSGRGRKGKDIAVQKEKGKQKEDPKLWNRMYVRDTIHPIKYLSAYYVSAYCSRYLWEIVNKTEEVVRIGLIKVTSKQRCEGDVRVIHVDLWRKYIPGREKSWVSGQEHLQCLDNMKVASVAKESKWENGGDEIKEVTIWSY